MAPSGPMTAPALQALLQDTTLAGDWALDASKSRIGLRSKSMWGLAPVKGVFREVSGQGTVSPAGEVSGTITVAAESVDTKNNKRDTHLRSGDFFDTDNTPRIIFSVDRLTPSGDGVTVTGSLTVRGRLSVQRSRSATAAMPDSIARSPTFPKPRTSCGGASVAVVRCGPIA